MRGVLVVGPDWNNRRVVVAALRYGGFETDTVGSVTEAGRRLRRGQYAGIVIDLGQQSTAASVAELRARTQAPIIVVSAASEVRDDKIDCLDAGADDYVMLPFDPEELLARLRAVLRRTEPVAGEPPIATDDFTIELAERRVVRNDGTEVPLSPIEWKLVEALARRADHLVTREELLASVWGPDAVEKTQYLRVHMASIRQKMEPDHAHPRYFVTAPGLGLRFLTRSHPPTECAQG
jgi:two-component system, OmpR family, KDP operon response regulator KdpE